MKISLIFALFLCSVSAVPEKSVNFLEHVQIRSGINDQLREMLEKLKEQLPCGFPELGVPPLAPFKKLYTEVEYENPLFSILGVFLDSQIDGLNNYTVHDVTLNVFTLKSTFDINFNKIDSTGNYLLNLFLVNIMKISGKGDLDVVLEDLRIKGGAQIGANDNGLYLRKFDIIITLGNIESNISGLLGGGLLGRLANRAIENFTLFFIKNQQKFISETIHNEIVPRVNSFLDGKSITDLLEIINSAKEPGECIVDNNNNSPKIVFRKS